jgi:ribosomal protein S8
MKLKILAIINRGIKEKKKNIDIPYTPFSISIIKLLYKEGYIFNYIISYNIITIELNIYENKLIINNFKLYKRTNPRIYLNNKQLKKMIFKKNKRLLLSTSKGILSNDKALKYGIGGLILSEIR